MRRDPANQCGTHRPDWCPARWIETDRCLGEASLQYREVSGGLGEVVRRPRGCERYVGMHNGVLLFASLSLWSLGRLRCDIT